MSADLETVIILLLAFVMAGLWAWAQWLPPII